MKKFLTIFSIIMLLTLLANFSTNIIYYGNHLYHHDIPVLISESALLDSF